MNILQNNNKEELVKQAKKHIEQIRKGEFLVFAKKIITIFGIILTIPIFFISFFILVVVRISSPFFLIRWDWLDSPRIGQFAKWIELYFCNIDAGINKPKKRYLDLFYLRSKYICNRQLGKMWRRKLIILPRWLLEPIYKVNRFINIFIPNGRKHEIGNFSMKDTNNLLEKYKPHLNFTESEEIKGKKILKELGLKKDDKFVCLLVRDAGYLNRHQKYELTERWTYHNYRDGDIDKYVLAAEELANRGYYVFRMGINVLKPLKSSNPRVIDYSNLKIRSDFADIYLGAKCSFCISTGSGFDEIPIIFRKPIAYASFVPLALAETHNKNTLILIKDHISKKNRKRLTISEIFNSNVGYSFTSEEYESNNIELKENSPEEIKDLVIEMDERLKGTWVETEEDLLFQKQFWLIFQERIKKKNIYDRGVRGRPLHGIIKAKYGAKYLRANQDWIKINIRQLDKKNDFIISNNFINIYFF